VLVESEDCMEFSKLYVLYVSIKLDKNVKSIFGKYVEEEFTFKETKTNLYSLLRSVKYLEMFSKQKGCTQIDPAYMRSPETCH